MMGAQVTQYAAGRGRTIDLTKAPLIDQPVVDVQGKPNLRGMYRQGIFADVMSAVGRATRTRTMGGSYSIETTRPIQRNMGGGIFYNNGDQVPGPNVNADVVPAMLTPGEFVIRRDVAQQDPEGMRALNEGRAVVIPVQNKFNGGTILRAFAQRSRMIGGLRTPNLREGSTSGPSTISAAEQGVGLSFGQVYRRNAKIYNDPAYTAYGISPTVQGEFLVHAMVPGFTRRTSGLQRAGSSVAIPSDRLQDFGISTTSKAPHLQALPSQFIKNTQTFNDALKSGATSQDFRQVTGSDMISLLLFLKDQGVPPQQAIGIANDAAQELNSRVLGHSGLITENLFGRFLNDASIKAISNAFLIKRNRGGIIPGYARGGSFQASSYLYRRSLAEGNLRPNVLPKSYLLKALGAKFSTRPGGKGYEITSLPRVPNLKMFAGMGLTEQGQKVLYNELVSRVSSMKPQTLDTNVKKGFGKHDIDTLWGSTVGFLDINKLSDPNDKLIIRDFAERSGRMQMGMPQAVVEQLFGKRKLNSGGRVSGGYTSGIQKRVLGGAILRMLAPLAIMQGGTMLGNRIGGGAGSAISMASQFLPFMMYPGMFAGMRGSRPSVQQRLGLQGSASPYGPTLAEQMGLVSSGQSMPVGQALGMRQSIFAGTRAAGPIASMAEGPNKFVSIAGKALAGVTKLNLALGLGTTAVVAGYKAWQNYNETQRLSAAAFGMTAESAQKAGLKFTDYNTKVKDAIAAQKLMLDQNMLTYESLQSAGTPFKMTIAEYKKLRKELKETMAEQIKVINATSRPDAARVAVQLKEQLMAAGLSAEEAAKRIYTLFNLSNKAGMAVSVINTDAFKQIVDAQTNAASALQSFNYAKNFENTKDAAAALNTALTAINTGVEDLVDQSEKAAKKKKQEFNETTAMYEAEKKQLQIIADKVKGQESIGQGVLNQLKKQNPEIEKFVNSQDTAVSIFQKLRLVARGFTGDLANLNAQQTDAIYKLQIATAQAVETVNQKGMLASQYKAYNDLKKQRDALAAAAKGQSVQEQINVKERLKFLDKEIKKINDKAEAKKKALREEAQAEDMALRIQQQQLEYQKAVAAGDFGGAASAQLELRRLQNEQQVVLTEQQIEERRLKDIGPLERERERIQEAQDKLADKAALAAESLDSINKRLDKQKEKIDNVNAAMTNLQVALQLNKDNLEKFKQSDEFKGLAGKLVEAVRSAGLTVANTNLPDVSNGQLKEDVGQLALDLLGKYGSEVNTIVASKGITVEATGDIVVNGKRTSLTSGTRDISAPSSEQLQGASRAGSAAVLVFDTSTGKWTFTVPSKVTDQMITYDAWQKGKKKYASGGLLRGPGTGTSDSILGMYADGGMVRVSNGEYIVNADTVSKLGVPFFDRINGMKNGGLMLNYSIPKYDDGGSLIQTSAYSPATGGSIYNVGNVTMQFAEAPSNGRQLFEEFKMAMALEQRKSGTEINMSRRY
jgi:hypothetical protein